MAGEQLVQVHRLELLAGKRLMDGGHFQDSAENLGHRPMAGKGLVVKKQILQGTFFTSILILLSILFNSFSNSTIKTLSYTAVL